MAVPKFPSNALLGPFAADDFTAGSMTALYIYALGVSQAEMNRLIGWRDKAGALIDGAFTNQLQARAAGDNAATLETCAIELDADTSSPHFGRIRLKITVGATAA